MAFDRAAAANAISGVRCVWQSLAIEETSAVVCAYTTASGSACGCEDSSCHDARALRATWTTRSPSSSAALPATGPQRAAQRDDLVLCAGDCCGAALIRHSWFAILSSAFTIAEWSHIRTTFALHELKSSCALAVFGSETPSARRAGSARLRSFWCSSMRNPDRMCADHALAMDSRMRDAAKPPISACLTLAGRRRLGREQQRFAHRFDVERDDDLIGDLEVWPSPLPPTSVMFYP